MQEATEQAESKKNDPTGPWKTTTTAVEAAPVEEAHVEEKRPEVEVQKARYVPPSMRSAALGQPLAPSRLKSLRSAKAPELENTSEFPSLGAEAVRAPAPAPEQRAAPAPVPAVNSWRDSSIRAAVRTENKFDALRDH